MGAGRWLDVECLKRKAYTIYRTIVSVDWGNVDSALRQSNSFNGLKCTICKKIKVLIWYTSQKMSILVMYNSLH